MRTTTMAGRLAAGATALLLAGACSPGPQTADPVDLENDGAASEQLDADGWDADIDEQDRDEIEIDQDIEDADPGSYDLGDAGSFAFQIDGGRLVRTDLQVADGWTLVEPDEEDDGFGFELANGATQDRGRDRAR